MEVSLLIILTILIIKTNSAPPQYEYDKISLESRLRKVKEILDEIPLIDGHNDFPMTLRMYAQNKVADLDINDLTAVEPWQSSIFSHTDIKRLREGKLGAQFWSAYVSCETQHKDAVPKTWEQIDVIHRMIEANPDVFEFVTSAQGIENAFARGKIGSLIGIEGGHSIGNSLGNLRMFYSMGVRYLTLTHSCTTPWGDNSQLDDPPNEPVHNGLTPFGMTVVLEMNRLGMLIDLAHVSERTMRDSLLLSQAPVIFSHSSAYSLCNNTRNVKDDVLQLVAKNNGIVMVNFFPFYVTCGLQSTLQDVANHIDYIKNIAGIDHVGIGSDFNGTPFTSHGLEDVSKYPSLFAELLSRGWTDEEMKKLAGKNLLRVLRQVEQVRDNLQANHVKPYDDWIPKEDLPEFNDCITEELKRVRQLE